MRDVVEHAISASGCQNHIHLAGNVDHAVTLRLIEAADVLLRTTLFDGDAISVREALYLGTSVVATDNGMRPSDVELFNSKDVDGYIAAICRAVENDVPARAADDGSGNVRKVIDIYRELA
jgi:glycosyltransferase involved in cell wall biosynthesis